MKRVTPPRSTGDLHVTATAPVGAPASTTRRTASARRSLAHRLEEVVDGAQLEGLDGVLLVGGHEHDRRRRLKRAEHLGEVEPGEAGHLDVEEDRVDLLGLQHPQRLGRRVGWWHLADARVAAEQEGELVERGPLVVDRRGP